MTHNVKYCASISFLTTKQVISIYNAVIIIVWRVFIQYCVHIPFKILLIGFYKYANIEIKEN